MIPGGGGEFRLRRRLNVTSRADSAVCLLDIGASFRGVKLTTQLHLPPMCGALPPFLYGQLQGFSLYDAA